ncbi:MAG: hypothetical protein ACT4PY_00895 [Armatimonadota bacterium]
MAKTADDGERFIEEALTAVCGAERGAVPGGLVHAVALAARRATRRDLSGGVWLGATGLVFAVFVGLAKIAAVTGIAAARGVEGFEAVAGILSSMFSYAPARPGLIPLLPAAAAALLAGLLASRRLAAARPLAVVALIIVGMALAAGPAFAQQSPGQIPAGFDKELRDLVSLVLLAIAYIAAVLLLAVGVAGSSILLLALIPDRTRFAAGGLSARPGASFGLGVAQFAVFLILAAGSQLLGEVVGGLLGVIVVTAESVLFVWGAAIAATGVGSRLLDVSGGSGDPRAEVAWGSGIIGLTLLMPIVGWALTAALWLGGTGAALGSILRIGTYRPLGVR